jgi:putative pyrroloquinoline-quinone binding quinoprotein
MVRVTMKAVRRPYLLLMSSVLTAACFVPGTGIVVPSSGGAATVGAASGKAQVMWTVGPGSVLPQRGSSGGPIMIIRGTGTLAALTPASGATLWQQTLQSTFGPEPTQGPTGAVGAGVVWTGTVFVIGSLNATPGAGARVMVFNQDTGALRWRLSSAAWSPGSITAGDGVVVVTGDPLATSARPRGVYALRSSNGSTLWHDEPSTEPFTGGVPVVGDGLVLIPSRFVWPNTIGAYTAVDAISGQTRWTAPDKCIDGSSSWYVARNTLYLTCLPGDRGEDPAAVFAIDPVTGAQRWTTPTGVDDFHIVDATTRAVYLSGFTTVSLNAATGAVQWRTPGWEVGREGTQLFLLQSVKRVGLVTFQAGRVVDTGTGALLGTFSFAGGLVNPPLSIYEGNEAVSAESTPGYLRPRPVRAVRLPTSGWTPPAVAMAATPDGGGYWIAGQDGGVFTFGDAPFEGSLPGIGVNVDDIVGMATTPDGRGYWLVGADGGVFAFGDASFYGSATTLSLAEPIVSMAGTLDGGGYWLLGADGGVFAFGDASFYGSATGGSGGWAAITALPGGGYRLLSGGGGPTFGPGGRSPASGTKVTTGGAGTAHVYDGTSDATGAGGWTVRPNGSVLAFGGSTPYGSLPKLGIDVDDVTAIATTPDGGGYWLLGADGGVFSFGNAQFYGSRG